MDNLKNNDSQALIDILCSFYTYLHTNFQALPHMQLNTKYLLQLLISIKLPIYDRDNNFLLPTQYNIFL